MWKQKWSKATPEWPPKGQKVEKWEPGKLVQTFQGVMGKGQGFWGSIAPKVSPEHTRKKK
jgi:hypothetical protein